ncbi:MAG: asparagine synthase (glutamine-hydrolyzing) [Myxococcota bacterium]
MCGFAGILERPSSTLSQLELATQVREMLHLQRHRGPDGGGLFQAPSITLGHRRLSIVDLEQGWQPLREPSGRLTLVFNGEIYNYPELRRELMGRGHRLRSHSDTEVLLHLWLEEGVDCLSRLNGMFALAVWDADTQTLTLARDRFGIKPLHYVDLPDAFGFASEIKGLLPMLPDVRMHLPALREYATFQIVLEQKTFFEGVLKLPPASWLQVSPRQPPRIETWWQPDFTIDSSLQREAVTARVGWLLEDAVRLNLRGDVLMGAYLSGGLDSSSVVMMAREVMGVKLPCFTGTFREGPAYDETPYARLVAQKAHAQLVEHEISPEALAEALPTVAWHLDEPCAGPGALPQFLVAQEAARHVKVMLGGQGGDELFGGYARYLVAYLEESLRGAIFETQGGGPFVVTFESILPNLPLLQPYVPLLKQFWRDGLFEPVERRYLKLLQKFSEPGAALHPDLRGYVREGQPGAPMLRDFQHPALGSLINKMMWVDQRHFLPALLQVEDRMSMASGIESRVPLLDHRLVELLAKTPPTVKFAGGELKVLLKRAMGQLLPREVLERRDKLGFPVPLNVWAQGPLKEQVRALLLGEKARQLGLLDVEEVEKGLEGRGAFDRELWGMMALESWGEAYLNGAWKRKMPNETEMRRLIQEEH